MPSYLEKVLLRLLEENLPSNYTASEVSPNLNSIKKNCPHASVFEDPEADADDPRWQNFFIEYFLENCDEMNDDMLFFVRQLAIEDLGQDPVFVRRKMKDCSMPLLDDPVLWKETFFLNLIVQLNCRLRVSVCRRGSESTRAKTSSQPPTQKFLKMVVKRVYALPSRSRLDSKDSEWECSYPLIYYAVEDHDDMFDQLIIGEGEHLCVELLCSLNSDADEDLPIQNNRTDLSPETKTAYLGKRPNSTVSLFQGAATYNSLISVLTQKLALKPKRSKSSVQDPISPEYIIMRGPEGKGHAQVALGFVSPCSVSTTLNSEKSVLSGDASTTNTSPAESPHVSPSQPSFLQSLKRLSLSPLIEKPADPIQDCASNQILGCSITFVNVPWSSIIK
ncbi:hypothetical protein DSO57_1037297 [Entomophthora muscae]|uniref:Uncharacterized protein n=1 Tax=Entomophthora muscae TaxID=34485 RepID=A0ACC2RDP3_9FUNG|nr:hypothetical protein DSO57_1037297 [Entomophthora muscae]